MIRFVILFTCAILSFLQFTSCRHSTEPPIVLPDTTSHNFTWEVTALGDGYSNILHDVGIIHDRLAYLGGEIFLRDSTGQMDPILYNLAIWNGSNWTIRRVPYIYQGSPSYSEIRWIFAINEGDIWLGNSVHWDGQNFHNIDIGTFIFSGIGSNRMWGSATGKLYVVGNSGATGYSPDYGATWQKLESGTTVDLRDITGTTNGKSVWTCGYSIDLSKSVLLRSDGGAWSTVWNRQSTSTPPYGQLVLTVWAGTSNLFVGAADGVYRSPLDGSASPQRVLPLSSVPHRIRGTGENNIAVACDDGSMWHYNGATWKQLVPGEPFKPLYGIAVSANLIIAVGFDATTIDWKGWVVVGRRN